MDNPAPARNSSTQSDRMQTSDSPVEPVLNNNQTAPGLYRVTVDQLLMAGAHFGHLTQRWDPKMKPYIFMARNGIYLIDLQKTQALIEKACRAISKIAASGQDIMFVGTKKQARDIVEEEAVRGGCPYITYRWLGGMLTNFSTIRRSLKTLETFEQMELDGTFEKITKKEQLSINKQREKLTRVLGGIRNMRRLPGALFITDIAHDAIAVAEARKLGIPTFAIVDTNVNPELVDYPIPANDDAFKSIWLISRTVADAVLEGRKQQEDKQGPHPEKRDEDALNAKARSRRSRRRRRARKRGPEDENAGASQAHQSNAPAAEKIEQQPQEKKTTNQE